jgi:hypothetical protein
MNATILPNDATTQENSSVNRAGFISEQELLSTILPVSRRTLFTLRENGELPFVRLGRKILYHPPAVLEALLRKQTGGGVQ